MGSRWSCGELDCYTMVEDSVLAHSNAQDFSAISAWAFMQQKEYKCCKRNFLML